MMLCECLGTRVIGRRVCRHCSSRECGCAHAEAQSLAASQAGDAGAAAFSNAVYSFDAVRECLGGRAMQAQNAADGRPLNPQPPPPPPSGMPLHPACH